ncbi:MAG: acyl-CoA dehydrogenase [Sphingomonadales bacterium]|nr:acyl-CoA dehydrogenase [Sphingomonadales bacterium]
MHAAGALSEEQVMLREMAAGWLRDRMPVSATRALYDHWGGGREGDGPGYDPEAWAEMAAMGWAGIIVPESCGGLDFGVRSLGLVLEEIGRTLAAAPLAGSALVAASALLGGNDAQRQRWLPGIADGTLVGALALEEGPRHAPASTALTATPAAGGWRLDGSKRPVADGMGAGLFVTVARTSGAAGDSDGLTLFAVPADTPGLTRTAMDQIDARRPAELRFDGVSLPDDAVIGTVGNGWALLAPVLDRAAAGAAAELLGLAEAAFETTVDYLKVRVQFGRLIGSFQALQHRAAELFAELQLARSAVEAALAGIDAGSADVPALVSLAKAFAGETALRAAREMIQMHGGIGMTHEHDAGLYLKRAMVLNQAYGNPAHHRDRWGRLNGY